GAVGRLHRFRRHRLRLDRATGRAGGAQLRLRTARRRCARHGRTQGPAAHGGGAPCVRALQRRSPVARDRARSLPARTAAVRRRGERRARAPGRTRADPRRAPARRHSARGIHAAHRGADPPIRRHRRGRGPAAPASMTPARGTGGPRAVRIAAGQGFWGDWLEAPYRQVTGGPIDYLMMDYLAEVTMSILQKQKSRDPSLGYAKDFVPLMERILPTVVERGIKVTANAGGVNPQACAQAVTDAARRLTLAPMIHAFDWRPDAWDLLAAGTVAGHTIECGAQCSGGNCLVDWERIPDLANVGYPIVEARPDGTFEIAKHPGTGGRISVAGVTEQLVYEMGDPAAYITPDCIADFTTIRLEQSGKDRVRVSGVRGKPATDKLKVSVAYFYGYKAVGTLVYAWPDAYKKARAADRVLRQRLEGLGLEFTAIHTELVGA